MENLKLSIIIPVYNGEKFIQSCLDKVLQIDLKKEIIVINDGSTDDSLQLLQAYGDKIILVDLNENQGVSHARNLGLERATGDYVTFIDIDDDFELDMHAKILTKMVEEDADVGICDLDIIELDGNVKTSDNKLDFKDLPQSEVIKLFLLNQIPPMVWTSIYCADLAKSIHFEKQIKIGEDMLYQLRILFRAKKTCFIDEALYHWVRHESSTLQSAGMEQIALDCFNFPMYLTEDEKQAMKQFQNEFDYFIFVRLKIFQSCLHHISATAKQNKKAAKKKLKDFLTKNHCREIIKNPYFPKYIKFEFWVIKTFGVGFHLFVFPIYQFMYKYMMPKKVKKKLNHQTR